MSVQALDVANYFLAIKADDEVVTNLKLQKLLYYAQGFHLVIEGEPLFRQPICAWAHGPVVPSVWRHYGRGAAALEPKPDFDPEVIPEASRELLDEIHEVYGQFSAWRLRELTHQEPPWLTTEQSEVITHDKLRSYFRTRVKSA